MSETVYGHGGDWVPAGMPYAEFRKLGYTFALRYVVPQIQGKLVTIQEIAAAHKAGVDVGFIYETSGTTWQGGRNSGLADGELARKVLIALGAPYSVACYHAVDSQALPGQIHTVQDWLEGVMTGMAPYQTGVYGEFDVVEMARANYPHVLRWQTKAWSEGRISQSAHMLQLGATDIGGFQFDIDVAYTPMFGQWYADQRKQPDNLTGDGMIVGFVPPVTKVPVPFRAGGFTTLALYCDTGLSGNQEQKVRVAIHSHGKAYSQIHDQVILNATPQVITFTEMDVDAVSFERLVNDGSAEIGYSIY